MSYKVKIRQAADSGNGISVEAKVEGVPVAHTFPKDMGFFDEPEEGKPRYVEKLEEKYEEKMKRKGNVAQTALTDEEKKIHSEEIVNKVYGEENFKDDENQSDNMEDVDFSEPEEIRAYLKENMAEGYLSKSEEEHIDEFVDEYVDLIDGNNSRNVKLQEIVRKAYESQVQ